MVTCDFGCRVTSRIVAGMRQVPDRGGEPVVVGEDDDLAVGRDLVEDLCEAVDLGRVHRLNRVVDDEEAERAVRHRRPGQEDAERQRVDLALGHDAERGARLAVDGDIKVQSGAGVRAGRGGTRQGRRCSPGAARPRSPRDWSASGASRRSRSSSVASASHLRATLSEPTGGSPVPAVSACAHQAATSAASGSPLVVPAGEFRRGGGREGSDGVRRGRGTRSPGAAPSAVRLPGVVARCMPAASATGATQVRHAAGGRDVDRGTCRAVGEHADG